MPPLEDTPRPIGHTQGDGFSTSRSTYDLRDGVAQPADSGPPPLPTVPGYQMVRFIARGGMGDVFLATQVRLNRLAAVKLMRGWVAGNPAAQLRFTIEAEAVAQLDHPNVVTVYESGTNLGVPYLAMEYVSGGTLADRLDRPERMPAKDAAGLMEQLAGAVAAAHAKGIVHRDLKPSNVMLTVDGIPKVTDFGLARIGDADVSTGGAAVGTPNYMSPEQAEGRKDVGTAADVWALGCILYRLLTGRLPFEAGSPTATLNRVREGDPDRPRAVAANVPRDLETICLKCLEKDPARRYATADALRQDLAAYLAGRPIAARPGGAVERCWKWAKRNPVRAATMAAGLLAAVSIGLTVIQVQRTLRQARAEAAAEALATAESAAVPDLIDGLAEFRELARPRLHQLAARPVAEKPGLHARFALLPDEPHRLAELTAYAPTCRTNELVLYARMQPLFTADAASALWGALARPGADAAAVLRAAAVLATWQPADPRWKVHVPTIADHLTRINPFEAEVFARSLRPVRDVLLPELRARYVEAHRRVESEQLPQAEMFAEFARCELTAGLLARWVDDRPADLADAAVIVADRHYPLLAEAVAANRDALVPLLLAELDCRPGQDWEAVAAGRLPTDTPLAAALGSAAERSITLPDEQVVQCHRRRANAAAVLFTLGRIAAAWPLLVHTADPTVRSHLIARLAAVGADPAELARRYAAEPDVSVRRAVLLALGDFPPVGGAFTAALLADYAAHRDPGVHSALGWLLGQKWGMAAEVAAIDARLRAPATAPISHGWLVNEEGQTFAVVRAPLEVRVGSPVTEWRRMDAREPARRECLDRSFAVATREVTVAEYRRFRHWHPPNPFNDNDPLSPVVTVSWYDAAAYCNWLSLRDGIDLAEWCYEMTDGAKAMWAAGQMFGPAVAWCRDQRGVGKGYKPRPDHLLKKGYRLPTETEWEAVARAGADTARPFGRGTSLLPRYAWFDRNAGRRTHPVGRLWPNDRGLFDTLGNAWEWCDDAAVLDEPGRTVTSDRGTGDPDRRVFRGGSFFDDFGSLRCANRNSYLPGEGYYTLGFRPVRTIP